MLKNALDYLFNEWKGKGAMIVSYGGHGGGKCNRQLREVLMGVRMAVTATSVELSFPEKEFLKKAAGGKDLELDGNATEGTWIGMEREQITKAYGELIEIVGAAANTKAIS